MADEVTRELSNAQALDRVVGLLALIVPTMLLRAWILYKVWQWFAPPNWPALPLRGAVLIWLIWLLWVDRPRNGNAAAIEPWPLILFKGFVIPLIVLGVAWVTEQVIP